MTVNARFNRSFLVTVRLRTFTNGLKNGISPPPAATCRPAETLQTASFLEKWCRRRESLPKTEPRSGDGRVTVARDRREDSRSESECRGRESNPHDRFRSQDFKSCASANFATPAWEGYLECTRVSRGHHLNLRTQSGQGRTKDQAPRTNYKPQFAVGGRTPSTTMTSTRARSDSSFNPS
jgi:hypothetical protein